MSVTLSSRKRRRYASDWQTQVSISNDHTLRSRVKGNFHARFWIGGGGGNPSADHTNRANMRPYNRAPSRGDHPQGVVTMIAVTIVARNRASSAKSEIYGFSPCMKTLLLSIQ